jgi:hypothetical protein
MSALVLSLAPCNDDQGIIKNGRSSLTPPLLVLTGPASSGIAPQTYCGAPFDQIWTRRGTCGRKSASAWSGRRNRRGYHLQCNSLRACTWRTGGTARLWGFYRQTSRGACGPQPEERGARSVDETSTASFRAGKDLRQRVDAGKALHGRRRPDAKQVLPAVNAPDRVLT